MSRKRSLTTKNMVAPKERNRVLSCSTPEHETDSPSRDSDSLCDSEAASPVPFLCTQDGAEGETDVVWNYYTPKAEHEKKSKYKNTTPLSRKPKKAVKKFIDKPIPKRRPLRSTQKRSELFQDLIELNQNIHKFIENKTNYTSTSEKQSGSEDDIFNNSSSDCSPKSGLKTNSRCLRKNLLSSKFNKPDCELALESDDSMNECLIKASQIVEENILKPKSLPPKFVDSFHDSMDGLLSNIKLDSPLVRKVDSPLKNDSFDSFVGNLNDSVLDRLTQMPAKNATPKRGPNTSGFMLQEIIVQESPSKTKFGRHSSMPESPSISEPIKPSTSGMIFGRYSSMPHDQKKQELSDSPIRCTPEEIRKKHLQAREKLLAKRLLPFTSNNNCNSDSKTEETAPPAKKVCFQPKVPTSDNKVLQTNKNKKTDEANIKLLIEKKRQEALMKLRRKQPQ